MLDFHCPDCGQALTAPDDAAGKMSKCPACGAIAPIPARVIDASDDIVVAELADERINDPFLMGPRTALDVQVNETPSTPVVPSKIDPIRAFAVAWSAWKRNSVAMTAAVFLQWVLTIVVVGIAAIANSIVVNAAGEGAGPLTAVVAVLQSLTHTVMSICFAAGLMMMGVDSVRGKTVSFSRLFGESRHFLRLLFAVLLYALVLLSGLLMLVIPGLVIALAVGPWFQFFVVDRNARPVESIQIAWLVGKNNIGPVLGLCLFSILISVVGLAACVVGIFVAVPLVLQLWSAAYLQATGQPCEVLD